MIRPFTKRHGEAIYDGRVTVKFPQRLNSRVWKILVEYDHEIGIPRDRYSSWVDVSRVINETARQLLAIYGYDSFKVKDGERWEEADFERFVRETYPSQVLDVVELFWSIMEPDEHRADLTLAINMAFQDERCPWRLGDGQFFKVDSEFLERQVLMRAHELLNEHSLEGALAEFVEARNDLEAGDHKGAIHSAGKALESVLKTILGRRHGTASQLLEELETQGYLDDLPEQDRAGFRSVVLMSVPFMRNRLGGHGQGEEELDLPRTYASLAVHMAGSAIQLLVDLHLARLPQEEAAVLSEPDDDLPF